MTKKELVLKAFHNEATERIPVGFWHHYMEYEDFNKGMENPEIFTRNIEGHKAFKEKFSPDFLKIMTDGLFFLPYDYAVFKSAKDLKGLECLSDDHPWFEKNLELVRTLRKMYGNDILVYFNVFAPMTQLRDGMRVLQHFGFDQDKVISFLEEDAQAVSDALCVFAESLGVLMEKVVKEGLADGIYFSVSNPSGDIPATIYDQFIAPSERLVIEKANKLSPDNILHICGNVGNKNMFTIYKDYEVRVVNWAVQASGMSLKDGRELFKGKAVIGGFDNAKSATLYSGTREEIEQCTEQIVNEAGRTGLILGADCTIPADIEIVRLNWVREIAESL